MNAYGLWMIIYVLGLILGALVLSLYDVKTGPKVIIQMLWIFIFLIMLFYREKKILNKQN